MKRPPYLIAMAACLIALAMTYGQPTPSAPEPLREIVAVPDGGAKVTQPNTTLLSKQVQPVTTGVNGRGIVVFAQSVTLCNLLFTAGSDDALGLVGDCRGSLVTGCTFPLAWFGTNLPSKALICYTGSSSGAPGPMIGGADGFAGTFIRNDFQGSAIRIRDGVWRIEGGSITIGQLYGIDMIDPTRANIVGVNFRRIPKPADATYWTGVPIRLYRHVDGKYLQTWLASRLYIANCTIDGVPATPQQLCPGVPSYVFRATPN